MVIHQFEKNEEETVKFISYTGKYPCLCVGILTLEIEGEKVTFGYEAEYQSFWSSGGSCGFLNGYSDSYVNGGEWIINEDELPEKYQKYSMLIDRVFNENVEHGCCGGCL